MPCPPARITDFHVCPKVEPGPVPHVGGPVTAGEATVIIGTSRRPARATAPLVSRRWTPSLRARQRAHRQQAAARIGDPMSHGGKIVAGCPTVIIGSSPQAEALKTDKPFCEECERKKREREAQRKRGRI
jgi:uncharacterized Zn-binding protein involved in type VI secretion